MVGSLLGGNFAVTLPKELLSLHTASARQVQVDFIQRSLAVGFSNAIK
jgi:hypothetical protein